MGLLVLNRLMLSFQRRQQEQHRRRDTGSNNGLVSSLDKQKRSNGEDDCPQGAKRVRYSGPDLPEDILRHIHFLMPLRDAACAALVSHAFLRSWRCRPNITFSRTTLGLDDNACGEDEIATEFNNKADHILKKHSGFGLKTLEIEFCGYNANTHNYLNSWLEIAATPQLEELTLLLSPKKGKYCFPTSLLSNGSGNSIWCLKLSWCVFSSTIGLDCLKNLTSLSLHDVRIIGDELGFLLSNSTALEHLTLTYCSKISWLNIPSHMKQLRCLSVILCEKDKVQVIESKAPNISTLSFSGEKVQVLLAESFHVKQIELSMESAISYACANLPSVVPNLESLSICSPCEVVSTPVSSSKFLHLKFLSVAFSDAYDCFSLVSFLNAAPSLETFVLALSQLRMQLKSIIGDPSPLRQMVGHCHNHL